MARRRLSSLGGKRKAFGRAADFARALAHEADVRVPQFIRETQVGIVTWVYRGILHGTPVLTGRARENWSLTLTGPSKRIVDPGQRIHIIGYWHDATGAPMNMAELGRLQTAVSAIRAAPLGRKVHLTNNLAYIQALEGGWSGKAPAGMVEVTLVSLQLRGYPIVLADAARTIEAPIRPR